MPLSFSFADTVETAELPYVVISLEALSNPGYESFTWAADGSACFLEANTDKRQYDIVHVQGDTRHTVASPTYTNMMDLTSSSKKRRRSSGALTPEEAKLKSLRQLWAALRDCNNRGVSRIGGVISIEPVSWAASASADHRASTLSLLRIRIALHVFSVFEDTSYDLDSDAEFKELRLLLLRSDAMEPHVTTTQVEEVLADQPSMQEILDSVRSKPVQQSALHPRLRVLSRTEIVNGEPKLDKMMPHQIQAVHFMLSREKAAQQPPIFPSAAPKPAVTGVDPLPPLGAPVWEWECAADCFADMMQKTKSVIAARPHPTRARDHPFWLPITIHVPEHQCQDCGYFWNSVTAVIVKESCAACAAARTSETEHVEDDTGGLREADSIGLEEGVLGGILCDEPGLGKTVECISLICSHPLCPSPYRKAKPGMWNFRDEKRYTAPTKASYAMWVDSYGLSSKRFSVFEASLKNKSRATLVVMPLNVLGQWQAEIVAWAPHLAVMDAFSCRSSRSWDEVHVAASMADVILLPYEELQKPHFTTVKLLEKHFHRVIYDEMQFLRVGPQSKLAVGVGKVGHALTIKATYTWFVSATPFESAEDIRVVLRLFKHPTFDKEVWWHAVLKYALQGDTAAATVQPFIQKYGSGSQLLARLLRDLVWRTTRANMSTTFTATLPPTYHVVVAGQFTAVEQQLYREIAEKSNKSVGAQVNELRYACTYPPKQSSVVKDTGVTGLLELLRRRVEAISLAEEEAKLAIYKTLMDIAGALEHHMSDVEMPLYLERIMEALMQYLPYSGTNTLALITAIYERAWQLSEGVYVSRETHAEELQALRVWKHLDITCVAGRVRVAIACGDVEAETKYRDVLQHDVIESFLQSKLHVQLDYALTEAYEAFQRFQRPREAWVHDVRNVPQEWCELYDAAVALSATVTFPAASNVPNRRWDHGPDEAYAFGSKLLPSVSLGFVSDNDTPSLLQPAFQAKVEQLLQYLRSVESGMDCFSSLLYHEQREQALQLVVSGAALPLAKIKAQVMQSIKQRLSTAKDDDDDVIAVPPVTALPTSLAARIRRFCQPALQGLTHQKQLHEATQHRYAARYAPILDAAHWLEDNFGPKQYWSYSRALSVLQDISDARLALENVREYWRMMTEVCAREEDIINTKQQLRSAMEKQLATHYMPPNSVNLHDLMAVFRNQLTTLTNETRKLTRWSLLKALVSKKELGEDVDSEDISCVICRDEAFEPIITGCSHVFCEACLDAWRERSSNQSCPMCRVRLNASEFIKIGSSMHNQEVGLALLESLLGPREIGNRLVFDHKNALSPALLAMIKPTSAVNAIRLQQSTLELSTKIAMIIRRLLAVPQTDKVLVVSYWNSILVTIGRTLQKELPKSAVYLIGTPSDRAQALKEFRTEPTKRFLLINSESDCSGLTLTEANHIFIVEPSNTATKAVQLPGRICRLGQTKRCFVMHFAINDTVEIGILRHLVALTVSTSSPLHADDIAEKNALVLRQESESAAATNP